MIEATKQAIETATTADELADALSKWARECSEQAGESPTFWITGLQRCFDGPSTNSLTLDETGGMTIEELIPEVIDEWRQVRDDN